MYEARLRTRDLRPGDWITESFTHERYALLVSSSSDSVMVQSINTSVHELTVLSSHGKLHTFTWRSDSYWNVLRQ